MNNSNSSRMDNQSNLKPLSIRRKYIKENPFEQKKIQALYGHRASIKIFSDDTNLHKSSRKSIKQIE